MAWIEREGKASGDSLQLAFREDELDDALDSLSVIDRSGGRLIGIESEPGGGPVRPVTLRLSPGEHDLSVSYRVPAPAWRISYRAVVDGDVAGRPGASAVDAGTLLLQGWARVENRFDEDLDGVRIALAAGQPTAYSYELPEPASIRRGSTALLPVLSARLDWRRELLFDEAANARHPVAALRCSNDSGFALACGPMALADRTDNRSQSMLPFSGKGAELWLPFAVESDISVQVAAHTATETHDPRIDDGLLVEQRAELRGFRYEIHNRSDTARRLTIQRAVDTLPGELFETPVPAARNAGSLRWDLECPPGAVTRFEIRARRLGDERRAFDELSLQRVGQLLERGRFAPATRRTLETIREELSRIDENDQQIAALEEHRRRIEARQEHLRRNIGALAPAGDEGDVRMKMVRELLAGDGALSGIEQLVSELQTDSDVRRKAIASKVPAAETVSVG